MPGTYQSSSPASASLLANWINSITDAGAVADGATDSTAKLQAMIDASTAAGHNSAFVQPGNYKVSSVLKAGGGVNGKFRFLCVVGTAFIRSTVGIACSFVGSIANSKLTVASVSAGALCVGCNINYGSGWTTINGQNGDGTWSVTETVTVAAGTSMMAGAPILLIGNGVSPTASLLDGEVSGINVSGPSAAPTSGSTGIMLATMRHVKLSHCEASNTTAGFDMIGNCYGSSLEYCRAGFGGTCQVGWNVRGVSPSNDAGAGNQISAYQSWLCGVAAGSMVGPGADGVSFRDGQIGATGSNDVYGNFVLGKDYYTGRTGNIGKVVIDNVDMEQFGSWAVRGFAQINIDWRNCPVLSVGNTVAIGVMKLTNAQGSNIALAGLEVRGTFSNNAPIVMDGYGALNITEQNTLLDLNSKWAGASLLPSQVQSLIVTSAYITGDTRGYAVWRDYLSNEIRMWMNGAVISGAGLAKAAKAATPRALPAVASAAPLIWLDASNPATMFNDAAALFQPASGGTVTSFVDSLGTGRQVIAASGQMPKYRPGAYNGRSVLRFDGSSSIMRSATGQSWLNAIRSGQPFSFRMVYATPTPGNGMGIVSVLPGGQNNYGPGVDIYDDGNQTAFAILPTDTNTRAYTSQTGVLTNAINHVVGSYDGTTARLRKSVGGGDNTATISTAGTAVDQLTLGFLPGPGWYFSGDFCEFAAWPGVMTSAEMDAQLAEIVSWWGA